MVAQGSGCAQDDTGISTSSTHCKNAAPCSTHTSLRSVSPETGSRRMIENTSWPHLQSHGKSTGTALTASAPICVRPPPQNKDTCLEALVEQQEAYSPRAVPSVEKPGTPHDIRRVTQTPLSSSPSPPPSLPPPAIRVKAAPINLGQRRPLATMPSVKSPPSMNIDAIST